MSRSRLPEEIRSSQEFQSGVVRLALWLVVGVFVGAAGLSGHYSIDWDMYATLFALHLVWFVALLRDVIRRPALNRLRSYCGIAADLSAITLVIYLCGDPLGPLYLVYVLSLLSQGARFGRTNLTVASIGSVVCYGIITTVMDAWQHEAFDAGFVLSALIILPVYQYTLLRSLQRARDDAEHANRARGDFLATMTHELRTPLSGVVGMTRLLRDTELDRDQRTYADAICSSADTLQALIGDILDLSKVDAGTLALERRSFDLRATVIGVCRNLAQTAHDKGVELVCCIDANLPAMACGDPVRVEQILYNLVGNAVKFTAQGRICIEVDRAGPVEGLGRAHVLLRISDTGIGMDRDQLDCIFDTFWQADGSASRQYAGVGLGTTISHRLVRAMGGCIEADSVAGAGTTFDVRLPLLPEDGEGVAPPRPPAILRGCRVLVMESDPEGRAALVAACAAAGMVCVPCAEEPGMDQPPPVAEAGPATLALIADRPAGDDCHERAGALRARLAHDLPIVYLRSHGRVPDRVDSRGITLGKPFNPVDLWRAMARLLTAAAERPAEHERARARPAAGDRRARILVAEDDAINARLIRTVLEQAGHEVVLVHDGVQALEVAKRGGNDLALVDMRMPGMDGIAFVRALRRRDDAVAELPVIALTANAAVDTRAECLAAGMDDFLTKPIEPDTLDRLLRRFTAT